MQINVNFKVICVDFDGTLCEFKFPDIGKPNIALIEKLIMRQFYGHKIILWTCREGQDLQNALEWCKTYGLEFDAINENIPEFKNRDFAIRKVYADIYLDDRNVTIPDFILEVF